MDIVLRALPSPIQQIAEQLRRRRRGGRRRSRARRPTTSGYDANTGKYVDMFKAGIIDPPKVVRTALQNAASIAGLMLTTETLITDLERTTRRSSSREPSGEK